LDEIPLRALFGILFLLILLSAFFSSSETGMMALNRYRLRHLANDGLRSAVIANKLLNQPDKLLGLILFGNTLVNIAAASVATIIGLRLMGETGIAVATLILTAVILIFAEVAPKTVAALYPERIAFPASYILLVLGKLLYPLVWIINRLGNGLLVLFGIHPERMEEMPLSLEELRTVVLETGGMIPMRHQRMLLSILDLENVTVDEIMVPRNEIIGIDLNDPPSDVIEMLTHCQHTRLPIYRDNIDNIIGMIHMRRIPRILRDTETFSVTDLEKISRDPYFVPLGTPLHTQLVNFQRQRYRLGLVVDEYGVIQGLVTLEDILEEIVGEFTTDTQTYHQDIHPQEDGTYVIDGTVTLRDINRQLHWNLPTEGANTLNGLILEQLQSIPEPGTTLRLGDFTLEIMQVADNAVKTVRIRYLGGEESEEPEQRSEV
jgi:Mg2+/Co2+ transporter CorB